MSASSPAGRPSVNDGQSLASQLNFSAPALIEICSDADVVTTGGQMPAKFRDAAARWCQRKLNSLRRYQPKDA